MRATVISAAILAWAGAQPCVAGSLDSARREIEKNIARVLEAEPDLPATDSAPRPVPEGEIDLAEAVRLALANNPDVERRREELRLAALSVGVAAHDFEPEMQSTVQALAAQAAVDPPGEPGRTTVERMRGTAVLGVEQRFPWGGSVSAELGGVAARTESEPWTVAPTAALELSQPVLRGAGIEYNFERLTSSKRALLYGLRGFKIQREKFALSVIRSYLDILDLERAIAIRTRGLAEHEKLERLSEVFAAAGTLSQVELLRARREIIADQIALGNLRMHREARMDQFKLTLGIPRERPLRLARFTPPVTPVREGEGNAVAVALRNRVDLKTASDAVEDADRGIRRAKNEMLPDLRIGGRASIRSSDVNSSGGVVSEDYSANITLNLPLDRERERFSLFDAHQDSVRTRRDLEYARESIAVAVRTMLAQLAWIEESAGYHDRLYELELTRYQRAVEEFDAGKRSNREVIDVLLSLLGIARERDTVRSEHYLSSLRFRQEIGLFELDEILLAKAWP